jgi:hypothetical protein
MSQTMDGKRVFCVTKPFVILRMQSITLYNQVVPAMIHKAKDLSPDQRAAIESLLGRRILEDENISVRAIESPALSDERKLELVEQLKKYFAEVDARRKPGSPEEPRTSSTKP